MFSESNINGHDYLRNLVHMPFYLQNTSLWKVKQAQDTAGNLKFRSNTGWNDDKVPMTNYQVSAPHTPILNRTDPLTTRTDTGLFRHPS